MKILFTLLLIIPFSLLSQESVKGVFTIYFSPNSSQPSKNELQKFYDFLELQHVGEFFILKVTGYTDQTGSDSSNLKLAARRINEIEKIFSKYNFTPIEKIIAGENYPSNAINTSNLEKWRKVEIEYLIAPSVEVIEDKPESDQFSGIDVSSLSTKNKEEITLNIQFMPGEDILLGDSYNEIIKLYDFLAANSKVYAFIRGHVCCENDFDLATARAYAVYTILVRKGIDPMRLRYEGFGNTIPVANPEITDEDRQKNRRVDVILSAAN